MPDTVMIPLGTLDDKSGVRPAMQIYCDSAQPWVMLEAGIQRFPKNANAGRLTQKLTAIIAVSACFRRHNRRSALVAGTALHAPKRKFDLTPLGARTAIWPTASFDHLVGAGRRM